MDNLRATIREIQVFQDQQALTKIEAGLKMLRTRMTATEEIGKAKLYTSQKIMEANRENMTGNEEKNEVKLNTATNTIQQMSETPIKTGQEKIWTTIRADQDELMTTIREILSAQTEFQETISMGVASIMASVYQQTQRLCEELNTVMEKLKTPTEATRRELNAPMAEVPTPEWRRGSRNAVPCVFRDGPWSSRKRNGRKELLICWQCGAVGHLRRDCTTGILQKQFSERECPSREKRLEVTNSSQRESVQDERKE
jgi:hypothetical protein